LRWAPELCIDAGLLYLPVGAAWLVLARAGLRPLGFSDAIVLLTAVHFHYTGFALPIIAGMTGRFIAAHGAHAAHGARPSRAFPAIAAGVILATPLIAAGITLSLVLEVLAVVWLVLSLWGLVWLTARAVLPRITARGPRLLLAAAVAALAAGMLAAGVYAVSRLAGRPLLTIPDMIALHGAVNAFGFVLGALLAWNLHHRGIVGTEFSW
jgi:hypothetical protein